MKEATILDQDDYLIDSPRAEDAGAVWRLVQQTGVLDRNSSYCYLVLFKYFSETCLVVRRGEELAGFVTALISPQDGRRLFVWQIGVAREHRGRGLAKRLLSALLARPFCDGLTHLETTVAPDNLASRGLFEALARELRTSIQDCETYGPECFPEAGHDPEQRLLLGPFDVSVLQPG
jgi:L-2,4-diaminobutyric acid acetyltransferase